MLFSLKTSEVMSGQYNQRKIFMSKSYTRVQRKYLCLKTYCAFPVHCNLSWQSRRLFSSYAVSECQSFWVIMRRFLERKCAYQLSVETATKGQWCSRGHFTVRSCRFLFCVSINFFGLLTIKCSFSQKHSLNIWNFNSTGHLPVAT